MMRGVRVPALRRKLLRDLVRLAGPSFAVAVVVASGITAYVTLRGAYLSIEQARARFYERSHFADVFARVERAPLSVAWRVAAMPGAEEIEARVSDEVVVDVPGFDEPVRGRLLSVRPDNHGLNRLTLREGRMPERNARTAGSDAEVVLSEAFALAHDLHPGDALGVIIDERWRSAFVVGVAASPEFVYTIAPGGVWPDDQRYGVLWMDEEAVAAALDYRGAWNDLVVKLAPGANEAAFRDELDRVLARWGGTRAAPREDQISHRFVDEELRQLETQTFVVPLIFLGVAALILHMVLARLVESQREIVGLLKAVGYKNRELVLHYTGLAVVIVAAGGVLGVAGGVGLGGPMVGLYREYYRFDELSFALQPATVVAAFGMSLVAGVVGALVAVQRVVRLQPAAAMQPPAPPAFSRGVLEQTRALAVLSPGARMVARQLLRRPTRSMLTVVGMSFAVAIIVVASAVQDAMRYMMDLTFGQTQREDVELVLAAPRPRQAVRAAVGRLPGVRYVEPTRAVPVRLENGSSTWEGALEGRSGEGDPGLALRLSLDVDGRALPPLPLDGIVLTDELARRLDVEPGDEVFVERLDQDRRRARARIGGLTNDLLGLHAAGRLDVLEELFPEGDVANGALLLIDEERQRELSLRLKELPLVAGASSRAATLETFERLLAESFAVTRLFLSFFASVIAVGIVYNSARISLAERARELATLRVLGLSRAEVSRIFLGEQLAIVVVAIPAGWLVGRLLTALLIRAVATSDLFRFPVITMPRTYLFATVVVAAASVVTAVLARRRLDKLDLVAVLKARE